MEEVLRSATIHPQSFTLSRQEVFHQPRIQTMSDGLRYTGAPLGQTDDPDTQTNARRRVNFNVKTGSLGHYTRSIEVGVNETAQPYNENEHIKQCISQSTACGPLQQFAICNDNTQLWETSIYARKLAAIASNSLSDLFIRNSVSVLPLESVVGEQ
ncbi:MAG: hypothetical protein EZS28_005950 [Streblomastix strix]|uniref:Uncharacterized protein n=1 Tax=Streblomastix strix TaxID=222440 RepID=A0A5J4WVC1_9EUKA|nr:MAG: hypothetical protein EZS28_005950 [Streblomastix strix]